MEEQQQNQQRRQPRPRRQFTDEFKRDAVALVRDTGRPIAQIAQELSIYDSTLGNWVRQDRIDRGEAEGLTTEEQARLRRLEAENTKLRMERDLLKRTVASGSRSSRHHRVDGSRSAATTPPTSSAGRTARWCCVESGMGEAAKHFCRLNGYLYLPTLWAALGAC
jgi:transposase